MEGSDAASRFTPGDHLRVWRPFGPIGYYHHGIYIGDAQVVQFGGRINDKPRATVGTVSLADFERKGCAKVVPLGGHTWWGAPRFDAIPRDVTVRRAKRLADTHPDGLYDVFGYNCEQAANFCSTNSYESYQVRGYFAVRALVGIPVARWLMNLRTQPKWLRFGKCALILWLPTGILPHFVRDRRGEQFMRQVGRPILQWERSQEVSAAPER
jgi:Lecithin retinol acyltransferase